MADHPALTTPVQSVPALSIPDLQALLQSELIAAWVRDLALQVISLDATQQPPAKAGGLSSTD